MPVQPERHVSLHHSSVKISKRCTKNPPSSSNFPSLNLQSTLIQFLGKITPPLRRRTPTPLPTARPKCPLTTRSRTNIIAPLHPRRTNRTHHRRARGGRNAHTACFTDASQMAFIGLAQIRHAADNPSLFWRAWRCGDGGDGGVRGMPPRDVGD